MSARGPSAVAEKRSALVELAWQTGTTLLFMAVTVPGLAALLLLCGGALGRIEARAILIAAVGVAALVPRATFPERWRIVTASALVVGVLAIAVSLLIYDTSVDGQHYHFQALAGLAGSWNPYWTPAPPPGLDQVTSLWVLHYPKAAWLFDATLVAAGLPLEATKAVNIVLLAASGLMLLGALGKLDLSWPALLVLTAATVFNPITSVQLFTRMNDGLIASCVLIFVVAAATWIARDDRKALFAAAVSMMFALNLKFSTVPLFALLCAATVGGAFVLKGWKAAQSAALHLLAAGLIGLLVFGWSPYVMNALHFGHPLYPLMGSGAADIMTLNTPDFLVPLSKPARFLFSLFATTHAGYETLPQLKLPLTVSMEEIRAAGAAPDTRIGGFGPLFSAVIMVAAAALALILARGQRTGHAGWLLYIAAVLLLAALAMPENWWARYIPMLWFVPATLALLALTTQGRVIKSAGWVIAALMLTNAMLVTASATALAFKRSEMARAQIAALSHEPGRYCVAADFAQSRVALMREAGIDAQLMPKDAAPTCAEPQSIAAIGPDRRGGRICPCSGP
jgi:hypothetical protein